MVWRARVELLSQISTTAWLPQWSRIFWRALKKPQIWTTRTIAYISFQVTSMSFCDGDQWDWIHRPFQYAPHPCSPDPSVYRLIAGNGVHLLLRIRLVPDQWSESSSHHWKTKCASVVRLIRWCRGVTVVLRSIILRKNTILPAGSTLQQNDSLPIRDNNFYLVHLSRRRILCTLSKACFLSFEMLAFIVAVFKWMPRKVNDVVGPSTLDSLMGALMSLHKLSVACKFAEHCDEWAGPAVKKSSK